jgi:hypothetical protein
MRIKFKRPTALGWSSGRRRTRVSALTPALTTLLRCGGLDGQPFAHVVATTDEEVADQPVVADRELAVTGSGRRRSSAVPR